MATLLEMSNVLAKTFIRSKNKKHAAKIIIREVSSLLYSDTKQPVDYAIKTTVIKVIGELINEKRPFQLQEGETVMVKQTDIEKFSKLEDYITEELWSKHELKTNELHTELNQSNVSVQSFTLNFSSVHQPGTSSQTPKFNFIHSIKMKK
jgi:hypothetical protein